MHRGRHFAKPQVNHRQSNSPNHRQPSLQLEMIILRNNKHGEITRVCMGIFTTALRNKKISPIFSQKIPHLISIVHCLLSEKEHQKVIYFKVVQKRFSRFKWVSFNVVIGLITSNTLYAMLYQKHNCTMINSAQPEPIAFRGKKCTLHDFLENRNTEMKRKCSIFTSDCLLMQVSLS